MKKIILLAVELMLAWVGAAAPKDAFLILDEVEAKAQTAGDEHGLSELGRPKAKEVDGGAV
ncbi:MAG TPA: hypothetical protein VJ873_12670 [bacterium]|nr:hypothetical protein [bacterium]